MENIEATLEAIKNLVHQGSATRVFETRFNGFDNPMTVIEQRPETGFGLLNERLIPYPRTRQGYMTVNPDLVPLTESSGPDQRRTSPICCVKG